MKKQTTNSIVSVMLFVALLTSFTHATLFSQSLPADTSSHFSGSGNCVMCHSAEGSTFITQSGEDISPPSLWRSTMMANAAKDPLRQAKFSAEVTAHPALQAVIEDKCTTCHAPMGRTEAVYHDAEHFSLANALADPDRNLLRVETDTEDDEAIRKTVEELGYVFKGRLGI